MIIFLLEKEFHLATVGKIFFLLDGPAQITTREQYSDYTGPSQTLFSSLPRCTEPPPLTLLTLAKKKLWSSFWPLVGGEGELFWQQE